MVGTDPGSAREEAERLVATALAALRLAGAGAGAGAGGLGPVGKVVLSALGHSGGLATGSAECTVCPICRTIAALRDPRPEVAERLAAGAGDLAAGVASLMRAFGTVTGAPGTPVGPTEPTEPAPPATRSEPAGAGPDPTGPGTDPTGPGTDPTGPGTDPTARWEPGDGQWRVGDSARHDLWPAAEPDVWAVATRSSPDRDARAMSGSGSAVRSPEPATGTPSGVVPAARTAAQPPPIRDDDDAPGDGA